MSCKKLEKQDVIPRFEGPQLPILAIERESDVICGLIFVEFTDHCDRMQIHSGKHQNKDVHGHTKMTNVVSFLKKN